MSRDNINRLLEQLEIQYQQRRQVLLRHAEGQCESALRAASDSLRLGRGIEGLSHLVEVEKHLQAMNRLLYQVTDPSIRQEYELSMTRLGREAASARNTVISYRQLVVAG